MSMETPTVDELFKRASENLKNEFESIRKSFPHYATSGQEAENLLIKFLNGHLPRRFSSTSGGSVPVVVEI